MPASKQRWVECSEAEATYWRVTCQCGDAAVKASKRNVQLHTRGHVKSKRCPSPSFAIVPLKRVELVSVR